MSAPMGNKNRKRGERPCFHASLSGEGFDRLANLLIEKGVDISSVSINEALARVNWESFATLSERSVNAISEKYYVYVLMRPDGTVFYVGKGQGNRINDHERDAKKGAESLKCDIIRKIWSEGGSVLKQKVAFFDLKNDAYALESLLIDFFGIENLANYADGRKDRSVCIQAQITRAMKEQIEKEAAASGMSVSDIIFQLLNREQAKAN
jgi:hypothetical protein